MAEQAAVNGKVVGSNPTFGACNKGDIMTITSKLIKGAKVAANGAGSEGDAYQGNEPGEQSAVKNSAKSDSPATTTVTNYQTKK